MVFGVFADAMKSRREGKKMLHVVHAGNQIISTRLPLSFKIVFWLTNVPYIFLTASVASTAGPPLQAVGPRWVHASALTVLTAASFAFHSLQIFGGDSVLLLLFLAVDTISALVYGLALGCCSSMQRGMLIFVIPVAFLVVSGRVKRVGNATGFAALHGTWHLLSAAGLSHLLYARFDSSLHEQLAASLFLGWGH
jgi:hypothetical protein